jgi:hypothetical protein
MIPIFGIMIGAYIITRMLDLVIDKAKATSPVVMIAALITILVAIYVIVSLITSGPGLMRAILRS